MYSRTLGSEKFLESYPTYFILISNTGCTILLTYWLKWLDVDFCQLHLSRIHELICLSFHNPKYQGSYLHILKIIYNYLSYYMQHQSRSLNNVYNYIGKSV